MLPAGSDLCRAASSCTCLCTDLRSVALCPIPMCGSGSAVRSNGRFDGHATVLRSPLHDLRLGLANVLPGSGCVLLCPSVLLCPGFGLLC